MFHEVMIITVKVFSYFILPIIASVWIYIYVNYSDLPPQTKSS